MAIIDKANVKVNFQTSDVPSEAQFVDLIDSSTVPLANNAGHFSTSIPTDASTSDIFRVIADSSVTLSNPTNCPDGKAITWEITQGSGGSKTITLDTKFVIPSSATTPLAFSTTAGKTDILAVKYNASADKFLVVSCVPGYSL